MVRGSGVHLLIMKIIPGTDNFQVTPDGRVFEPNGKERNHYRNGDGYVTCSVKVNGKWVTMGVHRLVAMAYIENSHEDRTFINHIDGNIENNHVENLEWATSRENNIHATLMKGTIGKPILILVSPSGEPVYSKTKEHACSLIGCDFLELWHAVKNGRLIDGWSVKFNDVPVPPGLKHYRRRDANVRTPVKVIDVDTGEEKRYSSIAEFSDEVGASRSLILQTLSTSDKVRLCLKKYIVVLMEDEFPKYDDVLIEEIRTRHSKPVISGNVKTGEITIHPSATKFYQINNLSKKAVTVPLRNDKLKELGGFVFLYLNDKNVTRIKDYLSQSSEKR